MSAEKHRRNNYNTKNEECQDCIYCGSCDSVTDGMNYSRCPHIIATDFYISSSEYEDQVEYYWQEMSYNRYNDTILTWRYNEDGCEELQV